MVKIGLRLKATLENIQELKPGGPDFKWFLKFQCCNCREESEKWNYASLSETVPASKGHGLSHYHSKCKLCLRESSMTILEDSIQAYTASDQDDFKTIVVFDCRGLEPTDFQPRGGWVARAINDGKEFTDVDLSEGEWADYCDKINQPVGIYDIEYSFERVK